MSLHPSKNSFTILSIEQLNDIPVHIPRVKNNVAISMIYHLYPNTPIMSIHIVKNNKVSMKKCTLFRRLIKPVKRNKMELSHDR